MKIYKKKKFPKMFIKKYIIAKNNLNKKIFKEIKKNYKKV